MSYPNPYHTPPYGFAMPGQPQQQPAYPGATYPPAPGYPSGPYPNPSSYPGSTAQAYPPAYPSSMPTYPNSSSPGFTGLPYPSTGSGYPPGPQYSTMADTIYPPANSGMGSLGGQSSYPQPPQSGYPAMGSSPLSNSSLYPALNPNSGYQASQYPSGGQPPVYIPQSAPAPYPSGQQSAYAQSASPYAPAASTYAPQSVPSIPNEGYPSYQQNSVKTKAPKMSETAYATVKDANPFYPDEDAKALRKAMKGFGTDEKAIIDVLAHRTNSQRQQIYIAYKTHFGRDLITDLKDELSGRFEDAIVGLMVPTYDYLAQQVRKSMSGLGTDDSALIEILCTRSNHEIRSLNESYLRLYKKPMEKDIMNDTSGYFRKLLVSSCMGNRDENPNVDSGRASQDAQRLYQSGTAKWGTEESTFNSVLVTQHHNQLREVFMLYEQQAGKSLEHSIKSEFSGDIENGLLAIVKCAKNTPAFYAEQLQRSMVGAGTDDCTLIRIIVTRCEVDMVLIKQEFQRMYGKTLESWISNDCSGDYKKILVALVS